MHVSLFKNRNFVGSRDKDSLKLNNKINKINIISFFLV